MNTKAKTVADASANDKAHSHTPDAEPGRWQITDFLIERQLGQGRFGRVYLARHKASNQKVAIKLIKKDTVLRNQTYLELRREIEIHSHLNHRHIAKMYAYFHDAENVYIVMEYIDGGSLFQQLNSHDDKGGFSEALTAKFVVQLASALDYLSKRSVIHRDLKLENILVCATTGRAKVTDFGCAVHSIVDTRATFCGTIEYLSPELVRKERYDARVDVWSLGVLMYEMLFRDSPFKSASKEHTMEKISALEYDFPDDRRRISEDAKDLIRKLLAPADERVSTQEIITHPFIVRNIEASTPAKAELNEGIQRLGVSGQVVKKKFSHAPCIDDRSNKRV